MLSRFRMQQVNIVGSSPMSAPSRLIQTLQAAPDSHPSNLSLVSATQTSLRFNWKVPHTQPHTYVKHMVVSVKPLTTILFFNTYLSCANLTGSSFMSLRTCFVFASFFFPTSVLVCLLTLSAAAAAAGLNRLTACNHCLYWLSLHTLICHISHSPLWTTTSTNHYVLLSS